MRSTVCALACVILVGAASPAAAEESVPPPVAFVATGTLPIQGTLLVGDVTGDGDPDVVTDKAVFVGVPGASFQPVPVVTPTGARYLGDVNGDGRDDFIVLDSAAESLHVTFGTSQGTFAGGTNVSVRVTGGPPRVEAVVVADFNGDGHPDLGTARRGGVVIFLGSAGGSFTRGSGAAGTSLPYINVIDADDMDHDGLVDIVVDSNGDGGGHGIDLIRGNGDGTFQPPQRILGYPADEPQIGDFNGDGNLDVAFLRDAEFLVGLGDGHGAFPSVMPVPAGPYGLHSWHRGVGDVDGNGRSDIVTAVDATQATVLLSQASVKMACTTNGGSVTIPAGATVRSSNRAVLPPDRIRVTAGTVTIRPVAGRSTLTVTPPGAGPLTFTVVAGSSGDDTITGTEGADLVFPGKGRDVTTTLGGDDLVCDAGGDDRITTGVGNDVASGGRGGDTIITEAGADTLLGGPGDDTLTGGPDEDRFAGGGGRDITDFDPAQGDRSRTARGGVPERSFRSR
ncbi:FG-GAP-like repeat-containing protein [Actinoplanes sp. NPDC049599]|uniref:FG-GAP-like repeat-containing protein n=1 Tax=Actinoplanes sp. NPDC049599 TaxID=3363903 RepID=UPI0037933CE7